MDITDDIGEQIRKRKEALEPGYFSTDNTFQIDGIGPVQRNRKSYKIFGYFIVVVIIISLILIFYGI